MARFNRKKRLQQENMIEPETLSPLLRQGFTQEASDREIVEGAVPWKKTKDGIAVARDLMEAKAMAGIGRVPRPRAIVRDKPNSMIEVTMGDERVFREEERVYPPEVAEAIRTGHMCIQCNEPQPMAFPLRCDFCDFPMRERQALQWALEWDGNTHIGADKPIREHLSELEEMRLEREFRERIEAGSSRMLGLRRRAR